MTDWAQIFTVLLFYAYMYDGTHQVRTLVFDNYQTCTVPLSHRIDSSVDSWLLRMYSVLAFGMTFYSRSTLSHPFSFLCSLPARLSGYEPDNEDYEEFEAFMEHIGEDPKEQVQYMCM